MDYKDKKIANNVLNQALLMGKGLSININEYENLKDFLMDAILVYKAPIIILPKQYGDNVDFIMELIRKNPDILNELYDTMYFTYEKLLGSIKDPQRFLSRCSKYCELNPQIKRDLQNLIKSQGSTY